MLQSTRLSSCGRWAWLPCSTWGLNSLKVKVLVAQPCPTLCNPIDRNPPGSSVRGILQARILEWVSISFSRGSSQPRDFLGFLHCRQILYLLSHQPSPPALEDRFLNTGPPGNSPKTFSKVRKLQA